MDDYNVAIYLWNGVEELDFAGPYEVLTQWARTSERPITVRTVADTADAVQCSHGLRIVPDIGWNDLGKVDLFVMPGGRSGPLTEDAAFLKRVSGLAGNGALMASVCTGAHVFAKAGLLDGRRATTHWGSIDSLPDYGTDIEVDHEARFVDTGDVVTAAGVSAGIDMALHLVARLESVERAKEVRRYIQYDPEPPV